MSAVTASPGTTTVKHALSRLTRTLPGAGHGLSRFSRMEVPYMPWFSGRAGPAGDPQ